nr:chromate efflux transporter [Spirulina subsalsa]
MNRESLAFSDGSVNNLIPGPNSTELTIHIGYEQAGWRGLILAGTCFILPAMLMVWGLAILYTHSQNIPQGQSILYGIKPVIIAIVLQALWNLGKKAIKDVPTILGSLGAMIAYFTGFNEVVALLGIGVIVMVIKARGSQPPFWRKKTTLGVLPFFPMLTLANSTPDPEKTINGLQVFLLFLKIGFVLYGSGYVLLAFLQREVIDHHQWLTSQQLLDAVAIGQLTPGPLSTTATFIGYLLAGNMGAIAATVGIFFPAFLLVRIVNPWVTKLRQSLWAGGFLDGVNGASLGLMVGVTYSLGQAALIDGFSLILSLGSAIAVFRFKINSVWLVLAGGVLGFFFQGI